jgi:hypothetical protein
MTIPDGQQDPYRNRKQGLSQNAMVACDFDLKFVWVHPGWEGSASDARVLQDALNHGFSVPLVNSILWMPDMQTHLNSLLHIGELDTICKNKEEPDKSHNPTKNYSTFAMLNFEIILRESLVY